MSVLKRMARQAAHAISDPLPGEKWWGTAIVLIFLWAVLR